MDLMSLQASELRSRRGMNCVNVNVNVNVKVHELDVGERSGGGKSKISFTLTFATECCGSAYTTVEC